MPPHPVACCRRRCCYLCTRPPRLPAQSLNIDPDGNFFDDESELVMGRDAALQDLLSLGRLHEITVQHLRAEMGGQSESPTRPEGADLVDQHFGSAAVAPPPPAPAPAASFGSGLLVMTQSAASRTVATLAAFCSARRSTFVGVMTPMATMSPYSSVRAL